MLWVFLRAEYLAIFSGPLRSAEVGSLSRGPTRSIHGMPNPQESAILPTDTSMIARSPGRFGKLGRSSSYPASPGSRTSPVEAQDLRQALDRAEHQRDPAVGPQVGYGLDAATREVKPGDPIRSEYPERVKPRR
jgi:hypothetical protein